MTTEDWAVVAAGVAAAAATGQLVVLALAALYARRQLNEARTMRLDTHRPYVVIEFVPGRPTLMDIAIRNVGPVPASDVRFRFEPEIASTMYDGRGDIPTLAEQPIFKEGIQTLAPNREIRLLFDQIPERIKRADLPDKYVVRTSYRWRDVEYPPEESVLDLTLYKATMHAREHDIHDVHDRLKEIRDALTKLVPQP